MGKTWFKLYKNILGIKNASIFPYKKTEKISKKILLAFIYWLRKSTENCSLIHLYVGWNITRNGTNDVHIISAERKEHEQRKGPLDVGFIAVYIWKYTEKSSKSCYFL